MAWPGWSPRCVAFYDAYRATYAPDVAPYTDAEAVTAALIAAGVEVAVQRLHYHTGSADRAGSATGADYVEDLRGDLSQRLEQVGLR